MPAPIRIPYRLFKTEIELQSDRPVSRFPAATLRGGFGYTLRRIVCSFKGNECSVCILKNKCIYPFLFESAPPADAPRLRKYRTVPRPFALRPDQDGSRVTLDLLLIGDAVGMLPFFIHTLNELGKHGIGKGSVPFTVSRVCTENGDSLYSAGNAHECREVEPLVLEVQPGEPYAGTAALCFKSPLALRKDGALLPQFIPDVFITTLLRRITNLNAFYGTDREMDIDPAPYIHAMETLNVETEMHPAGQSRFSTRQKKTIDYSGILGSVRLSGDIGTLMPLLKAGEVLGVGKNTVFGFGEYDLTPLSTFLSERG